MEAIKSRQAKMSKRGIYIQDRELLETVFLPGSFFKFEVEENKVIVLPTEEKGNNTVSKRQMKGYIKPVIDIRVKKVLATFEGCEELVVSLYENRIEIIGVRPEAEVVEEEVEEVVEEEAPADCHECAGTGELFVSLMDVEACDSCNGTGVQA